MKGLPLLRLRAGLREAAFPSAGFTLDPSNSHLVAQVQVFSAPSLRTWGRRVLALMVAFTAAPFATTGMWRLDIPTWGVALLCTLVAPGLLLMVPRPHSRWLAAGWIAGCVADAVFLLWLFSVWGSGMAEFGS